MDVKPVSSFIHYPCEPVEASEKETYAFNLLLNSKSSSTRQEESFWVLGAKGTFHSLLINAEMPIMPVLCRKRISSGALKFWLIMSAGLRCVRSAVFIFHWAVMI